MAEEASEKTGEKLSAEQARALLQEDQAQRVQACETGLRQLLGHYQCELVPVPSITADGRIVASIQIRAK